MIEFEITEEQLREELNSRVWRLPVRREMLRLKLDAYEYLKLRLTPLDEEEEAPQPQRRVAAASLAQDDLIREIVELSSQAELRSQLKGKYREAADTCASQWGRREMTPNARDLHNWTLVRLREAADALARAEAE